MDIKSMNFVYYSRDTYKTTPLKSLRYVWGNVDIRNYLEEDTIKSLKGLIIASNGGTLRVIGRDTIPITRRYQVVSEYTNSSQVKSKYILICPEIMRWNFSEITSEGLLSDIEQYIEIMNENETIKNM